MSASSGSSRLIALLLVGAASLAIPEIFAGRLVGPETTLPVKEPVSSGRGIATGDATATPTPAAALPVEPDQTATTQVEPTTVPGTSKATADPNTGSAAVTSATLAGWLSVADLHLGEKINRQCAICHSFEEGGGNKMGPNLWDVVGAKQAAKVDFEYSDAFKRLSGRWSFEELDRFLAAPQDYAPGTKMTFPGLRRPADRAAVLLWLRGRSPAPLALPRVSPEEAAAIAAAQVKGDEGAASAEANSTQVEPIQPESSAEMPATAGPTTAATDPQETAVPPANNLPDLLKAADASAGEKIAKKCAACHSFDKGGQPKVGPNLWDIVGAKQARAEAYKYSDALKSLGGEWTYEALDKFLTSPKEYASGTKMSFPGLKSAEERAAVIAWLRSLSDSPRPLP